VTRRVTGALAVAVVAAAAWVALYALHPPVAPTPARSEPAPSPAVVVGAENMGAARDAALAAVKLFQDEQTLRDRGASPEDIRALREERVGAQGADRLEERDRERARSTAALETLRAERAELERNPSLDPVQVRQILERRLAELFPEEQRAAARSALGLR